MGLRQSKALPVTLLLALLGALFCGGAVSLAEEPPVGAPLSYESYLIRPDILSVRPTAHPELGSQWAKIKRGHLEAVALLLESYPEEELYFLARDGEHLYDLAKAASKDDPALLKRLHLINLSRMTRGSPNRGPYLAQEGISHEALAAGKKILIVDTSGVGSASRKIGELFPAPLRSNIHTHLVTSLEPAHPSMRVFLTALDPAAAGKLPMALDPLIKEFESTIPHYNDWSLILAQVDGKWQPLSRENFQSDGVVSRAGALAHMEDLHHFSGLPETQSLLRARRAQWRALFSARGDRTQLVSALRSLLQGDPSDPFREAMVRDFLEMQEKNLPRLSLAAPIELSELGLRPIEVPKVVIHDLSDLCAIRFAGF
ncbi:MAG: hypothetical protein NDJ90_13305 [Oligoflexia bacterium]|nr:hypothetical protein [Oligoflexia bacterium]